MQQRIRLIEDLILGKLNIVERAKIYGVSRSNIYKWRKRFLSEGLAGLEELSRSPHNSPQSLDEEVQKELIELKHAHPTWGPKKIVTLMKRNNGIECPAPSSVGEFLKKKGLVRSHRIRYRNTGNEQRACDYSKPNECWSIDFKGQFYVEKANCYPLTLTDNCSRYLLRCKGLRSTARVGVIEVLENAFEEFGLPISIRSDTGSPFGSSGIGRLTRLNVWFIKLNIQPVFGRPGKPQDNGKHERMHLTLKNEACLPGSASMVMQQKAFDKFRNEYNFERPHEALGQLCPASFYRKSGIRMPTITPIITYPTSFDVRHVNKKGEIAWLGKRIFISEALCDEFIGLDEREDGNFEVYFGPMYLAVLGRNNRKLTRLVRPEWRR